MNHDPDEQISRTRRKQEAENLQRIGEKLLALPEARLAELPLPDALLQAVRTGRSLRQRGALRRQRQYIGRLMRELDTGDLQAALARLEQQESGEQERFHAAEQWRARMLEEGVTALEAFFDAYPEADRQRLRQLLKAGQGEARTGKAPRNRRELFREILALLENES